MRTKEKEKENGSEMRTRTRSYAIAGIVAIAITLIAAMMVMPASAQDEIVWEYSNGLACPWSAQRLSNGNTLITDGDNARVIEVTFDGTIVWEYSTGLSWPSDANRLSDGNTLISDWGGGRIIEVTSDGTMVWEYSTGISPDDVDRLSNGNTLISDCGGDRVIEVTSDGTIVWECSAGDGIDYPHDAERLSNGNTLIADRDNYRVIEVTSDCTVVWEYSPGSFTLCPSTVHRLSNGNTLISDYCEENVIEVASDGTIVWEYSDPRLSWVADAVRLPNGNTLIADGTDRVIEVGTLEPGIEVNKTVWDPVTEEWVEKIDAKISQTYRFRCEIHNNGTCCDLTDIKVVDNLSTSLEYVDGSATVDGVPREPDWQSGNQFGWNFAGPLAPCETITIKFDAHLIECRNDTNTQNATARCDKTKVSDEDTVWVNCTQSPLWKEINEKLDSLKGNVSAATMPSIIQRRLVDKLEYAKALKDNAKIECEAGNFDGATKKLGVAKSQVESFASMVKITRRISSADKASFLKDAAEIKGKIQALIEYIETEHKC